MASTIPNHYTGGRPSRLRDPEAVQQIAELLVAGCTREEIAIAMGVSDVKTVTNWKKDPRVQLAARKLVQDRVIDITRKVDSTIFGRLANPEDLTIKELLEIRKEFLGGALRDQTTEVDEATVNEALEFFESDPEAAAQLRALLGGGAKAAEHPTEE